MTLPRIGITLGDPGGIGPEIVLKALAPENSLPKAQYMAFSSGIFPYLTKGLRSASLPNQTGRPPFSASNRLSNRPKKE